MDISAVKACLFLLRTGSDVLAGFESMLARHGLSQGRFLTLMVLYRNPDIPLTPSRLARNVGVTRATMTGLLDGLEKDRLIVRKPDRKDRRRILAWITIYGIDVLQRMLPNYYDRIDSLMSQLDVTERSELIRLLEKVGRGLRGLYND